MAMIIAPSLLAIAMTDIAMTATTTTMTIKLTHIPPWTPEIATAIDLPTFLYNRLPQPQMNINDPALYPTLPTIHSGPQHTLGTIMPAYHQCNDEEYVLDLAIPHWCNMSPPSPPKTDAIPKLLPTLPPDYKIPRKRPCPLSTQMTTSELPQKKAATSSCYSMVSQMNPIDSTCKKLSFPPQKLLFIIVSYYLIVIIVLSSRRLNQSKQVDYKLV
uniref:Uncharacterized protein n=1 Tax=Romanomermis culicivorax TaxID=13658 RepID=A0A915J8P4_ROMCU